jgi:hypothetical protein
MVHRWRLNRASSTTDRWRVTCSCGRWRGFTETEADAQRLAGEHGREKGTRVIKIESRDDYRRRGMGRATAASALNLACHRARVSHVAHPILPREPDQPGDHR